MTDCARTGTPIDGDPWNVGDQPMCDLHGASHDLAGIVLDELGEHDPRFAALVAALDPIMTGPCPSRAPFPPMPRPEPEPEPWPPPAALEPLELDDDGRDLLAKLAPFRP